MAEWSKALVSGLHNLTSQKWRGFESHSHQEAPRHLLFVVNILIF